MEIKLERFEYIQERLSKLKCSQGCQSPANYIVYEMGLLCTLCLSKLGDIPQDSLASLQQLAILIADMTDSYQKNNKNGTNVLPLKAQIEQQNKAMKILRDSLTLDVKTIHTKTRDQIDSVSRSCTQQYRNQALQDIFQPDITASILVNESELFLANVNNLKVVQEKGEINYVFKESSKKPEESKNKALRQIESISGIICQSQTKVREIMSRFRGAIKKQ